MHNQISKNTVLHFKHQVVRDLAWSLWGPALLIHEKPYDEDSTQETSFTVDVPWLQQLDDQPSFLIEYLDKNFKHIKLYENLKGVCGSRG